MLRKQGGYGAFEIIGGAFVLSVFCSICYFTIQWMNGVKAQRARQRSPHVYEQKHVIKEVKPGPEFGSYIITFDL